MAARVRMHDAAGGEGIVSESDLYIDGAMLERTRTNLANISEILKDPGESVEYYGTRSAGVEELSDRLGEFDDEWSYGISKIKEFAEHAAEILRQIHEAWEEYDLDLARALREAS